MPTKYSLTIVNNTGCDQDYAFAVEPANVSPEIDIKPVVFRTLSVPNADSDRIDIFNEFRAMIGSARPNLPPGCTVNVAKSMPSNKGPFEFGFDKELQWPRLDGGSGGSDGKFHLSTKGDFSLHDMRESKFASRVIATDMH